MKYILAALAIMMPLNLMGACLLTRVSEYDTTVCTIAAAGLSVKDIKPIHDEGKLICFAIYYE
jgi:hypothetical protein